MPVRSADPGSHWTSLKHGNDLSVTGISDSHSEAIASLDQFASAADVRGADQRIVGEVRFVRDAMEGLVDRIFKR